MTTNQNGNANSRATDRSRMGLYASLGVLIGFSLILLAVSLFQGRSLLVEIATVLLGAMVTVVITYSLLKSQTAEQEKLQRASEELILDREKNTKVYEEKLSIYKEYLNSLCEILEKHKVSEEQQIKIQFQVAAIALHTPYDKIEKISALLVDILKFMKRQETQGQDDTGLLKALLRIVGTFKTELYLKSDLNETENVISKIVNNLQGALRVADTDGGPAADNSDCSGKIKEGLLDELKVEPQYRNKRCWQQGPDWSYCKLFSDGLKWTNKSGQSVEIGFYQGHYYIQANYPNATEFAKTMKWRYGGRRSYGQWWKHLEAFYDIKQGEFLKVFAENEVLQKTVTLECCKLMGDLEAYDRMETHRQEVEAFNPSQEGVFYYFIWEFEILCCQFDDETYLRPFIDMQWDGNKVNISIGNRSDDANKLNEVLGDKKCKAQFNAENKRYEVKIDEKELSGTLKMYCEQIKSVIEKK